jgi:hypothetical protein
MSHLRFGPTLALAATLTATPTTAIAQSRTPDSPEALLDAWVEVWTTFDLDMVSDIFIQDERLTYFSSEVEGLLKGFPRIVEHYRGFGFEPGGGVTESVIWVDEVEIVDFGDTAFIGAIWYFGDPDTPSEAQHGPMSVLAVKSLDGYRIGHMNFGTYAAGGG